MKKVLLKDTFKRLFFGWLITFSAPLAAKSPFTETGIPTGPPPRIIRTCCSFGADVRVSGLPFVKVTDVTSTEKIGPHKYLGAKEEENGIIYTRNGGFIDMGHLRDMADWTAYLYETIRSAKNRKPFSIKLGYEGGPKNLHLNLPDDLSEEEIITLAGKIAYDLSVWHEISTWFGASYIPMVPERYSSFSVEDAYSNLLGVHLGMEALKSHLEYDEAMTELVASALSRLGAVSNARETLDAMNAVKEVWWSDRARLPNRNVLLKRQFEVYDVVSPLLIGYTGEDDINAFRLHVPGTTDRPLDDFYDLEIRLNVRFPLKKMNLDPEKRIITQRDFPALIRYAEYRSRITSRIPAGI